MLIAASFIQLKHKDQAKYTSQFPTLNPRILLSGPAGLVVRVRVIVFTKYYSSFCAWVQASINISCLFIFAFSGSDIYQEMLAKALAQYFGAKLLIFDSHIYLGVRLN